MSFPVRFIGLLALGAFVPLVVFLTGTTQADLTSAVLAAINILLITGSIVLMFGSSGNEHAQGNGTTH